MADWVKPKLKDLKQEYHVEYELKGLGDMYDDPWPTEAEFIAAARRGRVVEVTPAMDRKIAYRSRTATKSSLLNLIRGYRSYPEFRNEQTIEVLYDRIASGQTMTMPLVLNSKSQGMRVMAGNTRMDVAFQLGVNPKVLMIDVD